MDSELQERIKARLNLYAVLRNLEDLVALDPEAAERVRNWDIALQFSVRKGPQASLTFKGGACTHERGPHPNPTVKLYFTSPKHLNAMFDGTSMPIPLKGFTKLGFLKRDFAPLTERLEHFLKPDPEGLADAGYRRINTVLTLFTGVFASAELAEVEPTARHLATGMGKGVLQIEVAPDGPYVHVRLDNGTVQAGRGQADEPRARMVFRNLDVANDLLNDRVDAFRAVVQGDVALWGHVPMIENLNLILERVRLYLA
ncbi:MAG TPA: hypothetical protein ENN80_01165 [Candidatus Hydrogenedentes bacterium]|nr:hypothetical protein [Candidatus Hydrogenedentota bacterium]